ncbi:MAG: HEAT repeat domain-containing protein [bacterium]|nr:HEAT repeat domain-containing protein [bacterium]
MNEKPSIRTQVRSLMKSLTSDDGMLREHARESLITLGKPAVSPLIRALLCSKSDQVRWESSKALGAINDTRSIRPLVRALHDSNPDVAWLAAEGLLQFQMKAWPPLLRALLKNEPNSNLLRLGAHHVFASQSDNRFNDLLATLTLALEPSGSRESTIITAYEILKRMRTIFKPPIVPVLSIITLRG